VLLFSDCREQSALESEKDVAEDVDEDEDMEMGKTDSARRQKAQQIYPLSGNNTSERERDDASIFGDSRCVSVPFLFQFSLL
jgi:hypothetical protein